jgi:hypothetical protein
VEDGTEVLAFLAPDGETALAIRKEVNAALCAGTHGRRTRSIEPGCWSAGGARRRRPQQPAEEAGPEAESVALQAPDHASGAGDTVVGADAVASRNLRQETDAEDASELKAPIRGRIDRRQPSISPVADS